MAGRLEGKVALITGAAGGMGKSHATLFEKEGAKVVIADIQDDKGQDTAKEIGKNAMFVHLDVTSEENWAKAVEEVEKKFGPITVLVNNAGITKTIAAVDTTEENYMQIIKINQLSIALGYAAVVPKMIKNGKGGSIINISSIEGMHGSPHQLAYSSSKFAVRGLTRVGAQEFAKDNIRVNSIHPGVIDTPILAPLKEHQPEVLEAMEKMIPLGRFAEPVEVSYPVLWLASDEASYITGSEFVIDGGYLA